MRYVVKCMTLLGLLLSILVSTTTAGSNPKLKLEIELSKETYLLNEPVWLDVTLTNISDDTVRIFGLCPACLNYSLVIELEDSNSKVIPYSGMIYNIVPGPGRVIDHGETYYRCFNLLETNGIFEHGLLGSFWLRYISAGEYTVRGVSRGVISQYLTFKVLEPHGKDKKAYDRLCSAFLAHLNKNPDKVNEKLQDLVDMFPNSVYMEHVHWHLRSLIGYEGFLKKFPNSGYNEQGLRTLTGKLSKGEKTELLQQIISDHPGTRSARFAQQMLKWGE